MIKEKLMPAMALAHTFAGSEWLGLRGSRLEIPRYTLTITAGLMWGFPKDIQSNGGTQKSLVILDKLMPALVSLNEEADIGISQKLGLNTLHPSEKFTVLSDNSTLRNWTTYNLVRFGLFLDNDIVFEEIKTAFEDFRLLSRHRGDFTGIKQIWLELDSGIYEAIILAAIVPGVLKNTELDLSQTRVAGESPRDYLQRKYKLFIFGNSTEIMTQNEMERKVLALHALEMYMKMGDDESGKEFDARFGIPNSTDCDDPKLLKMRYMALAEQFGLPKDVTVIAGKLKQISSVFRNRRLMNNVHRFSDDLYGLLTSGLINSCAFRHVLTEKGLPIVRPVLHKR